MTNLFKVEGQTLTPIEIYPAVSDTVNYLTFLFTFSYDWDGLTKSAIFTKGDDVFEVELTNDAIAADEHVNLSAGVWEISVVGDTVVDAVVTRQITTSSYNYTVTQASATSGGVFPPSIASQVYVNVNQATPQRFVGGIPKLAADREISDDNDLTDKKHVEETTLQLDQTTPQELSESPLVAEGAAIDDRRKLATKEYVDQYALGGSGFAANLYFTTIDSGVTGYKKISYIAEASETELSIAATTVEALARTYLYDDGLGVTVIDGGKWSATYRAKVSSAQGATIRLVAFLRHVGGTETELFSASSDKIVNTAYQTLDFQITQPSFECATTDRLGFRLYVSTTHPAGVTIYTVVGDGNASYVNTPIALRHAQLRDKNGEADVQHMTAAQMSALHAHSNKTALDAVSGTNTGDQDVSGAISTHNTDAGAHAGLFGAVNASIDEMLKDFDVYNANSLYHWRLLRAKQRAGIPTIGNIGVFADSVGCGYYANASMTDAYMNSIGYGGLLLEYYKTAIGDVGIGWKSCLNATGSGYWTFSGTWGDRGTRVIGGRQTYENGAYCTCDFMGTAVDLWLVKDPFGSSSVEIYIDDSLNQTVSLDLVNTATVLAFKVAITGLADSVHTIKIINKTTAYCVVLGLHEKIGTNGVSVLNFSRSGATTAYLYDSSGSPTNIKQSLEMYAYDLIIIGYMINDAGAALDVATFKTRYEAFVDEAKGNGSDVVLLVQRGKATTYSGTEVNYINAMKEVAVAKNVCFINIANRWKPIIDASATAQYLYDTDHPNLYGHRDIYHTIIDVLES